jgi:hypothetical protein
MLKSFPIMEIHLGRSQNPPPFDEAPQPLECLPWCLEQLCLTIYGIWHAVCAWIQGPAGAPAEEVENDRPCRVIVRVDDRGYKTQQKARGLPPPVWLKILGMLSSPDFIKAIPTCKSTAFTLRKWVDVTHRIDFRFHNHVNKLMNNLNLGSLHTINNITTYYGDELVRLAQSSPNLTTIIVPDARSINLMIPLNQHPTLKHVINLSQDPLAHEFADHRELLDLHHSQNLFLGAPLKSADAKKLASHPGIQRIVCKRLHNAHYYVQDPSISLETWRAFLSVPHLRTLQISSFSLKDLPNEAFVRWEKAQVETLILHGDFGSRLTPNFEMLADCQKLSTLCLDLGNSVPFSLLHSRDILKNIGKCTQLKRLALSVVDLDYYCLNYLDGCKQLEYLHLEVPEKNFPLNFTRSLELNLERLLKKLSKFKELHLTSTSDGSMSAVGLRHLEGIAKNLQQQFPSRSITATNSRNAINQWDV